MLVLVALTLSLAVAACSSSSSELTTTGGPNETAPEFFARLFSYDNQGDWGHSWEFLHPAQQRFVPRERYIECANLVFGGLKISDVKTEGVDHWPLDWEGIPERTMTSVLLTFNVKSENRSEEHIQRFFAARHDGAWVWLMRPHNLERYKEGGCPT